MCSTHPFAYLGLTFSKHNGKVFLSETTRYKNFINAVHNLERKRNALFRLRVYVLASFF